MPRGKSLMMKKQVQTLHMLFNKTSNKTWFYWDGNNVSLGGGGFPGGGWRGVGWGVITFM